MHSFWRTLGCAGLLVACAAPLALAQSEKDKADIAAIVQSEGDAWNQGDAEGFAAHYAENGSFTNVIGQQLYGRKAFIKQHALIFSTIYKGSHNTFQITHINFVRPDVAVVDIDGILSGALRLPPGLKAGEDGALHVKLQEVLTKEANGWTIRFTSITSRS